MIILRLTITSTRAPNSPLMMFSFSEASRTGTLQNARVEFSDAAHWISKAFQKVIERRTESFNDGAIDGSTPRDAQRHRSNIVTDTFFVGQGAWIAPQHLGNAVDLVISVSPEVQLRVGIGVVLQRIMAADQPASGPRKRPARPVPERE